MKQYKIRVLFIEVKSNYNQEGLLHEEQIEAQDVYVDVPQTMDGEFRMIYNKTLIYLFKLTSKFIKKTNRLKNKLKKKGKLNEY